MTFYLRLPGLLNYALELLSFCLPSGRISVHTPKGVTNGGESTFISHRQSSVETPVVVSVFDVCREVNGTA